MPNGIAGRDDSHTKAETLDEFWQAAELPYWEGSGVREKETKKIFISNWMTIQMRYLEWARITKAQNSSESLLRKPNASDKYCVNI